MDDISLAELARRNHWSAVFAAYLALGYSMPNALRYADDSMRYYNKRNTD